MWGELSVNHFLMHSNHFKRTLKMFSNGTVRFGYCLTFNLLTTALLPWRKKAYTVVHCKFWLCLEVETGRV